MKEPATFASIELFTGAGGLALGIREAGFHHLRLIEYDKDSCSTLELNRKLLGVPDDAPRIESTDAITYDWKPFAGQVELLAGGVPCQPFSLGGKHKGHMDQRNLFPAMLRAVREVAPAAVIIENVKGLLRSSFRPYFDYIIRQLSMPELSPKEGEAWEDHDARLRAALLTYPKSGALSYAVNYKLLNSADFGVPQVRERVFIVAYRSDLGVTWRPPTPTHSEDRLLYEQWVTGAYWQEHRVAQPKPPRRLQARIAALDASLIPPWEDRWRTVRDAMRGLPTPYAGKKAHPRVFDHIANPGARSYKGHAGSDLDWPAKTLKAGVHGVPGGENMVRFPDGKVRYFTAREAARLQTFPDAYRFAGSWGESFRQLGNAVAVRVGKLVADQVAEELRRRAESAKVIAAAR